MGNMFTDNGQHTQGRGLWTGKPGSCLEPRPLGGPPRAAKIMYSTATTTMGSLQWHDTAVANPPCGAPPHLPSACTWPCTARKVKLKCECVSGVFWWNVRVGQAPQPPTLNAENMKRSYPSGAEKKKQRKEKEEKRKKDSGKCIVAYWLTLLSRTS